ncbi:hypothetical protein M422DRAFT_243685 [Sphaerobolus stellatus SS14]|nr:hypothetical protein M422DRAFT_243685 [Sphaerobolus stellatus SS14]
MPSSSSTASDQTHKRTDTISSKALQPDSLPWCNAGDAAPSLSISDQLFHTPWNGTCVAPLCRSPSDGLSVSEAGSSSSSYRTGSSRAVQDSFGPEADVPTLVETFQDGQSIVLANAWLTLSNSLERCSGTPQTPPRSSSRRSFLQMNALISILARGHFV